MDKDFVPYIAYEGTMARLERANRRSWILTIILIILLFATNGAWLYYESQYEMVTETTTITQTNDDGINNYIGNDGDISNGEAGSKEN